MLFNLIDNKLNNYHLLSSYLNNKNLNFPYIILNKNIFTFHIMIIVKPYSMFIKDDQMNHYYYHYQFVN